MPNWKTYDSSVRLLSAILAAHPELKLNYAAISTCFGGDCTTSALENRFRRIKTDAKAIKECLEKGLDPITLPVEGGRIGDGASPAKKGIATNGNGNGAPKSTPKKKNPAKKFKATSEDGNSDDDEEEFGTKSPTSHKKGPLNKTQGGRVQKQHTPKKRGNGAAAIDEDDEMIKEEPRADFENHGYKGHPTYNGHNTEQEEYFEAIHEFDFNDIA